VTVSKPLGSPGPSASRAVGDAITTLLDAGRADGTVRDDADATSREIVPFVKEFFARQREAWQESGGELISVPAAEHTAMIGKISSVGNDLSQGKTDLNKAVMTVFESAKRNK